MDVEWGGYRRNILQWEENDMDSIKLPTGDYYNHMTFMETQSLKIAKSQEGAVHS